MMGYHKNYCLYDNLFRSILLISVIISINVQFFIVEHTFGQTDHNAYPIQNCLEDPALWDRENNPENCITYYCDQNKGNDLDDDYVTCSDLIYPDNDSSSTISQRSNHFTEPDINYQQLQFNDAHQRTECSFIIPNPPELVSQREQIGLCNSNTCWFAAITMILSYRDGISYSTNDILNMLDPYYQNLFLSNSRISDIDFAYLVGKLDLFKSHSYLTPEIIADMLQKYGPIMVNIMEDGNSLHVRLIIGISQYCSIDPGNIGVYFLDPEVPYNNNPIVENYDVFKEKFLDGSRFIVQLQY
jgi:hypothetical protein